MTARGFFVSGTDTDVGKTVVGCALVRGLRSAGIDVGVMKPFETGVDPDRGPLDAIALSTAAGDPDPLDLVCPIRFALPAAPNVAAAAEGRTVDLEIVRQVYTELSARHEFMVVEGAGGLLVPTTDTATMADLALDLGLPVLIVARGRLGTINHTRLSVEEALRRGLDLVGVAISHDRELSHADAENLGSLRRWLGDRLLMEIPVQARPEDAPIDARNIAQLVERLDRLQAKERPGSSLALPGARSADSFGTS
jgi:dethiobiotin synthetase